MSKLTGRAYIDIPGIGRVSSNAGATLNPGGFSRNAVVSDQKVEGFREAPMPPELTCVINHRSGTSLKQLSDLKDVNVGFETDSGSAWVLRKAWTVEPTPLTSGEVSLRMNALECDEVRA